MNLSIFLLHFALCAIGLSEKFLAGATHSQAVNVMQLISDGLKRQPAHPSGKAIILIGMNGAGKTTLAKFITGDNNRLVSVGTTGISRAYPFAKVKSDDYHDYDTDGGSTDSGNVGVVKRYYIKDLDDDKIGNDNLLPKTFHPEVYLDRTSGEVLVDCPGFSDKRSESHEIAIAVFMKHLFQWAHQVKIVVVVDYSDVTRSGDRTAFKNLLRFVTVLLKNYKKFNASLGLVATKVPTEHNRQRGVIKDEDMIGQIAGFLKSVQDELMRRTPNDVKVQVLATLLQQIGHLYPHISIFRRPYEAGPLQRMPAIQAGKTKIRKMLFRNLEYANPSLSDIGFTVTPAAEVVVIELCEMLKSGIDLLLSRLHVEFTGYYKAQANSSVNFEHLTAMLRSERDFLRPLNHLQSASLEYQLNKFVDVLVDNRADSYVWVQPTIGLIKDQTTYLNYLKSMTSSPRAKPNDRWKTAIKPLVQFVDDLAGWYDFLTAAFNRLIQYDFSSMSASLSVDMVRDWSRFKVILFRDLKWTWPANPRISEKRSLESHEQTSLDYVLHELLAPVRVQPLYASNSNACELTIEGNFVRLSDFNRYAPQCGNRSITAAYLLARHTLYINANFTKIGSEMLLAFVAPRWEMIYSTEIKLSGTTGMYQPPSNARHGAAGVTGGPGGTFFGTVSKAAYANSARLQIFTNGGNGGNGQMGQNGTDGNADVDQVHGRACKPDIYGSKCRVRDSKQFWIDKVRFEMKITKCGKCSGCCTAYDAEFRIMEAPGASGGYQGGKQGLGGKGSTSSQIIDLSGKDVARIYSHDGALGREGQGGKTGMGGFINGVYETRVDLMCNGGVSVCRVLKFIRGTQRESASAGIDNIHGTPLQPRPAKHHDVYSIITKYRLSVAKQVLQNSRTMHSVDVNFVEGIIDNSKIRSIINLHHLTDEFIALEDMRQQHPDSDKVLVFLDSILQSVEAAARNQTNSKSIEFSVVAHYLSAAIISRKLSIEYRFDRNLIVDLQLYLHEVSNQIGRLANLNHGARLRELNVTYNQDIMAKQRQADLFLDQHFNAEMTLVKAKIKTAIDGLQQEVTDLLAQLEADRREYVKLIRKARFKFLLNLRLKMMRATAEFVKLAGPKGELVGTAISVGADFLQDAVDLINTDAPNTKINAAIHTLDGQSRLLDEENQRNIRMLETKFSHADSANPNEKFVLDRARAKLKELTSRPNRFSMIQTELTTTIDSLRKERHLEESELLDRIQTSIYLTEASDVNAYVNIRKSTHPSKSSSRIDLTPTDVKALKEGLKELDANIKKVTAYERFVEDSLRGYLYNLTDLMVSIKEGSRQASAITLEISRFNLKKILMEVRANINKYTEGFEANEELNMCIDLLDNLMQTTLNLYDQIDKYNDQKNLGNLLAGISGAGLGGLVTNDEQLDATIRKLDHKIVSNTLQNQYIRGMQSYKQLVFPFAAMFLTDLQITEIGHNSAKDDAVMQLMISNIVNLQSKINAMRSSIINGYDDLLFSYNFDENRPFFVWNEVEHAEKISALLRGDEVTFKANVANSVADAVKFRDIGLRFVVTNASDLNLIDSFLKDAHIRLTHGGHSHYKCGKSYYVISHQHQVIEMSAALDSRGDPISSNSVYDKIKEGNILLSPYTLWKMKIDRHFGRSLNLAHLAGRVQLKLVGKGQYIRPNNPVCSQSLEQFYQMAHID